MVFGKNTKLAQVTEEKSILGQNNRLIDDLNNFEIVYEIRNHLKGGEMHG